jgi:phage replication O-like protein O
MANPQKEDGFVPLANEILEALARTRIVSEARQVFDVILRLTWGWNRKQSRISYRQFANLTGLTPAHVYRAIQYLLRQRLIEKTAAGYGIQKDYEQWISSCRRRDCSEPGYSRQGYSGYGGPPSGAGVAFTPAPEYPPPPATEQGNGNKSCDLEGFPDPKDKSTDISKDISLRERLLEEIERRLKGPLAVPAGLALETLDYFLYQIDRGRINVSRIKYPAAYLKALEITEAFPPYTERIAREAERREKERRFQQELTRSHQEYDPETGRRMVRRIIDQLGRKAP